MLDRRPQEANEIMEADPAIKVGVLTFELYPSGTFTVPERSSGKRGHGRDPILAACSSPTA